MNKSILYIMIALMLVFSVVSVSADWEYHEFECPWPPVFTSDAPDTDVYVGEYFTYDADASCNPTYSIVDVSPTPVDEDDMDIAESTGVFSWDSPMSGDVGTTYYITIRAETNQGSDEQTLELTVRDNHDPELESIADQSVEAGEEFTLTALAEDADGDDLEFGAYTVPTTALVIDENTGEMTWQTEAGDEDSYTVYVTVQDTEGGYDSTSFGLEVTAVPNSDPVFDTIELPAQIVEGELVEIVVSATDADGDALSFSLTNAPATMTITAIDDTSAQISWQTAVGDAGTHDVEVLVEDGNGGSATEAFQLEVVEYTNSDPVFDTIELPAEIVEGDLVEITVSATDADNDALSFTLTNAPATMTITAIDDTSAQISWQTATGDAGTHDVEVLVEDGNGGSATTAFQLDVEEFVNSNPYFTSTPDANEVAYVDQEYTFQVEAEDVDEDTLTFSLEDDVPTGMVIDASTGLISGWTPDSSEDGNCHNPTIVVEDGNGGSEDYSFDICVEVATNTDPYFTTTPDATEYAVIGEEFTFQAEATDDDGDTLTFSLQDEIPTGMTIDSTGLISGYTADSSEEGNTHNIEIWVEDGNGGSAMTSFTLEVVVTAPVTNSAPVLDSIANQTVNEGDTFSYTVTATDADSDTLTFSLTNAPTGMSINDTTGEITWTTDSDDIGVNSVTVEVSDGTDTDSQEFTVTVDALSELDQIKNDLDDLEANLDDMEDDLDTIEDEIGDAWDDYEDAEDEDDDDDMEDAEDDLSDLEDELDDMEDLLDEYEDQYDDLKDQLDDYIDTNGDDSQTDDLEEQLQDIEDQIDEIKATIDDLYDYIDTGEKPSSSSGSSSSSSGSSSSDSSSSSTPSYSTSSEPDDEDVEVVTTSTTPSYTTTPVTTTEEEPEEVPIGLIVLLGALVLLGAVGVFLMLVILFRK